MPGAVSGPEVFNIQKVSRDARTLDDWAFDAAHSIASHVGTLPKGSVLVIPDVRFRTYLRVDPDLSDILMLPSEKEQARLLQEKVMRETDLPDVRDFHLVEKNKPPGLGGDNAVCAAFIMPVWYQDHVLALLFYGADVFGLFTPGSEILTLNHILYLQLLESFLSLHLQSHLAIRVTQSGRVAPIKPKRPEKGRRSKWKPSCCSPFSDLF